MKPGTEGTTLLVGVAGPLTDRLEGQLHQAGHSVERLAGESTSIDFGLSGSEYRALVTRVERVVLALPPVLAPAGADVERSRSVRAAAEVLELVRAGGSRKGVVFLSSLLVFGNQRGVVDESMFAVGQGFSGAFEESLAVAERVLRHASELVPVSVLRVAPLLGSTGAGRPDPASPLAELVAAVDRSAPIVEVAFGDLPVRYDHAERVADALVALTNVDEPVTAHLVDDNAPTDRSLLEWLGEAREREFREFLPGSRGRRQKSPLETLACAERRALSGWDLQFRRTNAERLFPELLDPPQQARLAALLQASGLGPSEDTLA